jgi:acylpyruvate hydrolase
MRLTTVRHGGRTSAARVEGEELILLPFGDLGELLASGEDWRRGAAGGGETIALAGADFAPVVPRPEKIFGIGLNYAAHAAEAKLELLDYPPTFAMFWRCLLGANDDLVLPAVAGKTDWEAEMALVIGAPVRNASLEEAAAAIAGYTIVNDVSMRDWQRRTSQFLQGKTFERSTPAGPFLVSPDDVDHGSDLRVTCTVDGETMQDARTSDLHFKPDQIVSYLSQVLTLMPGDLIATGTPGGVGGARRPEVFLQPGQTMVTAIEGLGEQTTHVLAPNGHESR